MILPIVEGQSEVESVPLLIRRILGDRGIYHVSVRRGFRVRRDKLVKPGELEKSVEFARFHPNVQAVMVIVDADDDCPKNLGPHLLARGQAVAGDLPCSVAKIELEAWFIAGIESLRGVRGIRDDAVAPADPEGTRGAKAWLGNHMNPGFTYVSVDDQPAFAHHFNYVDAATRSRSLRKFLGDLHRISGGL